MKNLLLSRVIMLGVCLMFWGTGAVAGDIVSCDDLLNKLAPTAPQSSPEQKVKFRGLKLTGGAATEPSVSAEAEASNPVQKVASSSVQSPPRPAAPVPAPIEPAANAPSVDIYIYFKSGTSQIADARSWKQLDEVGKALDSQAMQGCLIEIGGHTDSIGDAGYNMKLSTDRANMVRQYLVSKYRLSGLKIKGYGESQPVASNNTDGGRALNRRVAITRLN